MGRPRIASACKRCNAPVEKTRDLTRRGYCIDCGVIVCVEWNMGQINKTPEVRLRHLRMTLIAIQNEIRLVERAQFDKAPIDESA